MFNLHPNKICTSCKLHNRATRHNIEEAALFIYGDNRIFSDSLAGLKWEGGGEGEAGAGVGAGAGAGAEAALPGGGVGTPKT